VRSPPARSAPVVKQRSRQPDTLEPEVRLLPGACLFSLSVGWSNSHDAALTSRRRGCDSLTDHRSRLGSGRLGAPRPPRRLTVRRRLDAGPRGAPLASASHALVAQEQSASLVWRRPGCESRHGQPRRRAARAVSHKDAQEGATPSAEIWPPHWIVNRPRRRRRLESGRAPSGLGCESSAIRLVFASLPRGVAQHRRALRSGRRGRECNPRHPDLISVSSKVERPAVNRTDPGASPGRRVWMLNRTRRRAALLRRALPPRE
jgi:hypothetical protein